MRFGLPDATIDKICATFSEHTEVERAVIYGSHEAILAVTEPCTITMKFPHLVLDFHGIFQA
jgi:hypothetical protein